MKNKNELWALRHSTEHVLTMAMINLYGKDKIEMAMGPATDEGFYFDFELKNNLSISENDFSKIEEEMQKIINKNLPFVKEEISIQKAKELFKDNKYKLEWIKEIEEKGESATIFKTGEEFFDLCAGPHAASTGEIKAFKLLSIAGAYWRGNENNKMLTRIYGTAFFDKNDLDEFIKNHEEALKRDHRKLGRELDLFTFSEYVGSGLPLYTSNGTLIRKLLNDFIEEEQTKIGYMQVWTPQIAKAELFKRSGHYDKYKNDMFRVISNYSDEEFYLKPMNCPQHTQIYASQKRSYRDLPIRMTDFAMLYRDEKPGELSGLGRVRAFSTDDCHIFCTEEQVDEEIDNALQMTQKILKTFGLKYRYRLSTRDPEKKDKYLGNPETWDKVEAWAVEIMKRNKIEYFDGPGEAAFYAPKMDLMATDALGREWQLSTIQIDYVQPERFGLTYTDKDGNEKTPIMIHRAVLGSAERFMMVMIEHFAGNFPVWLSPVQVEILPITSDQVEYAYKVQNELLQNNIRAKVDDRSETLQSKIRDAQIKKTPYMIILGKNEVNENKISIRKRNGDNNNNIELTNFIDEIKERITTKSLDI